MKQATVDLFEEVKARVSIVELVQSHGMIIKRNRAVCPFHKEDTPSLTVYQSTSSWHCFGCGAGGSVIDFTAKLYGINPLEAAKKIDNDFRLGLAVGELTEEQRRGYAAMRAERERDKRVYADYEEWESAYFDYLCERLHLMEQLREATKPMRESDLDAPHMVDYALVLHAVPLIEYQLSILTDGELADRVAMYNDKRGEVIF